MTTDSQRYSTQSVYILIYKVGMSVPIKAYKGNVNFLSKPHVSHQTAAVCFLWPPLSPFSMPFPVAAAMLRHAVEQGGHPNTLKAQFCHGPCDDDHTLLTAVIVSIRDNHFRNVPFLAYFPYLKKIKLSL
jgi:hypothetical protein